MDGEMTPALHSIQRYMIVGMVIVGFVTFGIGGWAATSELTGAVIGQGVLVVDSSVKKVQHPTGGIVGELRVREGAKLLLERTRDPASEAARAIAAERSLFDLRRQARGGQKAQLKERSAQLQEEIKGYLGQAEAKQREVDFIHKELEGVRTLFERRLVPMNRLTALERDTARLEGERSQLSGMTAQAKGKIAEIELQIIQIDQDLRT